MRATRWADICLARLSAGVRRNTVAIRPILGGALVCSLILGCAVDAVLAEDSRARIEVGNTGVLVVPPDGYRLASTIGDSASLTFYLPTEPNGTHNLCGPELRIGELRRSRGLDVDYLQSELAMEFELAGREGTPRIAIGPHSRRLGDMEAIELIGSTELVADLSGGGAVPVTCVDHELIVAHGGRFYSCELRDSMEEYAKHLEALERFCGSIAFTDSGDN